MLRAGGVEPGGKVRVLRIPGCVREATMMNKQPFPSPIFRDVKKYHRHPRVSNSDCLTEINSMRLRSGDRC